MRATSYTVGVGRSLRDIFCYIEPHAPCGCNQQPHSLLPGSASQKLLLSKDNCPLGSRAGGGQALGLEWLPRVRVAKLQAGATGNLALYGRLPHF